MDFSLESVGEESLGLFLRKYVHISCYKFLRIYKVKSSIQENNSALRTFIVFSGGSMSLLGLTKIGYPRGGINFQQILKVQEHIGFICFWGVLGPVGSFFGALVVACIWRHKSASANVINSKLIAHRRMWTRNCATTDGILSISIYVFGIG